AGAPRRPARGRARSRRGRAPADRPVSPLRGGGPSPRRRGAPGARAPRRGGSRAEGGQGRGDGPRGPAASVASGLRPRAPPPGLRPGRRGSRRGGPRSSGRGGGRGRAGRRGPRRALHAERGAPRVTAESVGPGERCSFPGPPLGSGLLAEARARRVALLEPVRVAVDESPT